MSDNKRLAEIREIINAGTGSATLSYASRMESVAKELLSMLEQRLSPPVQAPDTVGERIEKNLDRLIIQRRSPPGSAVNYDRELYTDYAGEIHVVDQRTKADLFKGGKEFLSKATSALLGEKEGG